LLSYIARGLAGLLGFLLICIAWFLRETEENKLRHYLMKLWITLDDARSRFLSREAALLSSGFKASSDLLILLFGRRWVSPKSILVTTLFSISSLLMSNGLFLDALVFPTAQAKVSLSPFLTLSLCLGILSALSALIFALETARGIVWILNFLSCVVLLSWVAYLFLKVFHAHEIVIVYGAGIIFDLFFIGFLRRILRRVASSHSGFVLATSLALVLAAGGAFLIPFYVAGKKFYDLPFGSSPHSVGHHHAYGYLFAISGTNVLDGLCCLLVFFVIALVCLHRLSWVFLERPLYAAERRELFTNSKALVTAGLVLLIYAISPRWTALGEFLKGLKGLL
jgi:hypothetical protein